MSDTAASGAPKKQTPYQFGTYVEHKAREQFTEMGWTVSRSASSHGPFDLVAINGGAILLIQCKRGRMPPPCSHWRWLEEMQVPESVVKVVVFYPTGGATASGTAPRVLWCSEWHPAFTAAGWVDGRYWPKQGKLRGL